MAQNHKIHIVSDSTCDLSPELIERYHIHILPLHVHLGDDEFLDGVNITPREIFNWSDANKTTPKTSAVSPEDAAVMFEKLIGDSDEVICFSISQQISTTGNVMRLAAEDTGKTERIHIIDSENLSTGIGLLVIEAAEMAANGMDSNDIVAAIERLKPMVRSSFVVDTLTYLHRGGRCSGLAAFAGSKLGLHPLIRVEGGKMSPGKKYRGKMDRVILNYANDIESSLRNAKPDRVFITHSCQDFETVKKAQDYLISLGIFKEIHITTAGSVISSHCGPGTLGILFIEQ